MCKLCSPIATKDVHGITCTVITPFLEAPAMRKAARVRTASAKLLEELKTAWGGLTPEQKQIVREDLPINRVILDLVERDWS